MYRRLLLAASAALSFLGCAPPEEVEVLDPIVNRFTLTLLGNQSLPQETIQAEILPGVFCDSSFNGVLEINENLDAVLSTFDASTNCTDPGFNTEEAEVLLGTVEILVPGASYTLTIEQGKLIALDCALVGDSLSCISDGDDQLQAVIAQ